MQPKQREDPCEEQGLDGTPLLGLYWRNLISTPLAFLIVLALNIFTPLGFFDEVRTILVAKGAWKLLVFVLSLILTMVGILQYLVQRPLAAAMKDLCAGNTIEQTFRETAQRRLLNLPFILGMVNLVTVPFVPAIMLSYFHYFMDLPSRPALFIFSRVIIVAMLSSTLCFFLVEEFSRRKIIGWYFPQGKLATVAGHHKNVSAFTDSSIVHWGYYNSDDHLVEHPIAHLMEFERPRYFPYGIGSRNLRVHRDIVWDLYCRWTETEFSSGEVHCEPH